MKVGLYFGSFNPIHIGHLIIAKNIIENKYLDEVWFVVSPQNPFKQENTLLNSNHRLGLIKLAIESENKIKASNVEFGLPKPSYTINTLTYLQENFPKKEFAIIMGSDGFQNIDRWKNGKKILENYEFYIYKRPGYDILNLEMAKITIIDGPALLISSSYIRNLIKQRKSIRYLVPDVVKEVIEKMGYYQSELENPS